MKPKSVVRVLRIALAFALLVMACGLPTAATPTAPPGGQPPPATTETSGQQPTAPPITTGVIAKNPSSSSPVAISDDYSLLAVVNTLNGSVTIFKLAEVNTGDHPQSVVITPDKKFAYVANQGSANVSVIDLAGLTKVTDIPVGNGPYGLALTPDGARAYVVNSASATVSIVETASNSVVGSIPIPGVQPRGVAITNNNGGQGPQFVYVTQFFSQPTASGGC